MHLNYPKKRDFWTWEELGCLAKTLGFQRDLFYKYIPQDKREEQRRGLKLKQINDLLESKALSPDLHRTFNMHDAAYNTKVIKKTMVFISNRSLTFQQIKEARLAFQLYEHMDNAGLVINEHTIKRTLKMCGRAISSIKLMQYIKHMDRLVPDRLMFYEFVELLLISEKISDSNANSEDSSQAEKTLKDNRDLYELCDFHDVLLTEDEKTSKRLNELHQRKIEKIPVRKSQKGVDLKQKKPWLVPSIVDHETREMLVKKNQDQAEILREQLDMSNGQVLLRSSFPSCDCKQPEIAEIGDIDTRSHAKDGDSIKPGTASSVTDQSSLKKVSNKHANRSWEYRQDPIVTTQELNSTTAAIEEVKWQIATQGEKMRQKRKTNTGKKGSFRAQETNVAEPEEKPMKAADSKVKHSTTRSLTDLIEKESPDLARKLGARLKIASVTKEEDQATGKSGESATNLQLRKPECDDKNKMTVDELLHQIDLKLDGVLQR